MGFWAGNLFANDHAADARDALVTSLEGQIAAAVDELTGEGSVAETSARGEWEAYDVLVQLDEQVLAPAAMIAALVDDPVVRAMGPDVEEVQRWRAAVSAVYAEIRRAEERADERQPTHLYNALPGRSAGGEFWQVSSGR